MIEKRLFLIDALSFIFSAYKSCAADTADDLALEFDKLLLMYIQQYKPTHIAFAFDVNEPTFRHKIYPQYKSNRKSKPLAILNALPIIKQRLNEQRIQWFEKPGYEADDIIGTLTRKALKRGFSVFIISADKDFTQLLERDVSMFKIKKSGKGLRLVTHTEICNEYAIANCHQLIDLYAFWGDAADNIPHIPCFGKRAVKKLLAEFGTIENVFDNLARLNHTSRELLTQYKEQILLNKRLARIDCDMNINVDWNHCVISLI